MGYNAKHKPATRKIYFEIYLSPHYSFRNLYNSVAYHNPELDKAYFNDREKPNYSFSGGIQLFYQLDNNWRLSSGFAYSQYSQKMKAKSFDFKTSPQNGYYIYTSVGLNDISMSSSVPLNNADFLKSSALLSFVNIPLIAEYSIANDFFIVSGVNYSYLFSQDINWKAKNFDGYFSIQTNHISGLNTSNLNFIVGAGFEKPLNSGYKKTPISSLNLNC